jgi:predicted nucleotidyltransferase
MYRRRAIQQEGALDILSRHRQELRGFGVKSIALFGSAARGEAQRESDIDILVEFDRTVGLLAFLRLQYRLEELLGKGVDLVTQAALKHQFRDRILKEAIYAG